jgi:hypothetical protein
MSRCIACNSFLTSKDLASDRFQELCVKCLNNSGVIFFDNEQELADDDRDGDE